MTNPDAWTPAEVAKLRRWLFKALDDGTTSMEIEADAGTYAFGVYALVEVIRLMRAERHRIDLALTKLADADSAIWDAIEKDHADKTLLGSSKATDDAQELRDHAIDELIDLLTTGRGPERIH